MSDLADLFPGFASEWINTSFGRIFARVGGKGPPLLLLHGFSETHVMWHRVAPQLADKFTLIIADLPGYGWSDMPESDARAHALQQARDGQGHGRGDGAARPCPFRAGRPRSRRPRAYRLALDHPGRLSRLAVLDILPTYDYWERMNRLYALKIYHWTFLAQPAPLPETLIGGNGEFFLQQQDGEPDQVEDARRDRPARARALPRRRSAIPPACTRCARITAPAPIPITSIDKADLEAGKKITIPMLALWGDAGIAQRRGDAARHLEDNGRPTSRAAGGLRAFPHRGKPRRDREGAARILRRLANAARLKELLAAAVAASLSPTAGIDLRRVVAGRRGKEPHAGLHRAALGVGCAVIEPADPRERDRARAHGAGLQRHIEVAVDQPLAADVLGGLAERQDLGMGGGIAVGQGPVAGGGDDLVIADDHAADRNFARFSGIFGRFQRQIHERGGVHASYHPEETC